MAKEDKAKTAFRSHLGLYQFKRMPFGLRNGPAIFQRIMQEILSPFLWLFALVYIDDIVVYSKSYADHLQHLDQVLQAVEESGITLSPSKCHFFYSSILLLGHKVSRLGLSTHEAKIEAIDRLAAPTNIPSLRTFLGMAVYFSAFIPYYSFTVAPLFKLLRQGCAWKWDVEEEGAFQDIKKALQNAPVLGHPIPGSPYRLYTDASELAIAGCLQQVQKIRAGDLKGTPAYDKILKAWDRKLPPPRFAVKLKSRISDLPPDTSWAETLDETEIVVERVIAYWSRTCKPAESRYSVTEHEALAAKEALVKFQAIVEGEPIILVTDHAALSWARTHDHTNRRLGGWGAILNAFPGLDIIHRPGREHTNVDPLSRLPRKPPDHCSPSSDPSIPIQPLEDNSLSNSALPTVPAEKFGDYLATNEAMVTTRAQAGIPGKPSARARGYEPAMPAPATTTSNPKTRAGRRRLKKIAADPSSLPEEIPPQDRAISADPAEPGGRATSAVHTDSPPEELLSAVPGETVAIETDADRHDAQLREQRALKPGTFIISASPETLTAYLQGYAKDIAFKSRWTDPKSSADDWYPGRRYCKIPTTWDGVGDRDQKTTLWREGGTGGDMGTSDGTSG